MFLAEQPLVTRVRITTGDEVTLGGTPDLVVFNQTDVRGDRPSVDVYDWKCGSLAPEIKTSFEAGDRDNKLGAVYYQMNLYAYVLEKELSVLVGAMHAVFFGQRHVEAYLLPRATWLEVISWIACAIRAEPPPNTQFQESSESGVRLAPDSVLPMERRSRKGRAGTQIAMNGKTWSVERLLDHKREGRRQGGKYLFFVKWLNHPDSANTWEPEENITADCIQEYWENRRVL